MDVTVISIIGGPDIGLIPHWLDHYRALGIEKFAVAVNDPLREQEYDRCLADGGVTPVFYLKELFMKDEVTFRSLLDTAAPTDWIISADLDELIVFDRPLGFLIEECQAADYRVVRGRFIDHLHSEGHLVAIQPTPSLWEQFPLMHPITRHVRRGWIIKAVLRHRSVRVGSGNHAPDKDPLPGCHPVWQEVHHFRWTDTTAQSLRFRMEAIPNDPNRHEFENVLKFLGDPPRLDLDRLRELAPFIEPAETFLR